MRSNIRIIVIVVALIGGAIGIGWLYFQANPEAWDAFMAEMEGGSTEGPSPPRTQSRPARRAEGLSASGTIEADEVTIASEFSGRIVNVLVGEGDEVNSQDPLLELDQAVLKARREGAVAAVAQANAALEMAQAQLAQAEAGATPEDIAAAEAAVLSAQGAVSAAEAALTQAEIGAETARVAEQVESSVAIASAALDQARGQVAAAEANLSLAEAERARLLAGARPEEVAMYRALLSQAQSEYLYVEDIHAELIENKVLGRPEERARYQSESAKGARDAVQAQLDLAMAGPTAADLAAADAVVSAAEAQVLIAEAGVAAAEATLSQAHGAPETNQDRVAVADAGIAAAQAQVEIARGQLAQQEAYLARLKAGSTAEGIAVLEGQVAQAEAALTSAQSALKALDIDISRTVLLAPSGGVILQRLVHLGELGAPGAPLFTLADLDEVTLTVYVPEAELGQVTLGQQVEVTVDAYDEIFAGQVSHIASEAEFTPKNVQTQEERVHMVFAVKIRLVNLEHKLKPGMPADAVFK